MQDVRTKQCCPNCCQIYRVDLQSPKAKKNLPLLLSCGHSVCENCVKNIVKFLEPIECRVCHKDMKIEAGQATMINDKKLQLYEVFPVNLHMLGELTFASCKEQEANNNDQHPRSEKDYYVNIGAILMGTENKKDCMECHQTTTKMCQQCSFYLCESCFTKSHKNFIIFKNHQLQDIVLLQDNNCKNHPDKPMSYYCSDCKKPICMDCFMVGGDKYCMGHNVNSMQEMNDTFLEEIKTITPNIDETFRRLTKTAVDVGNLLYNLENETGTSSELTRIISNIEQHFSKLCSIVQKHKKEVIDIVLKLRYAEKESLYSAKNQLTQTLKKAKQVLDSIRLSQDPKKIKKINLALLLNDAKNIMEVPWYLTHEEKNKEPLNVSVNEDLCGLMSDYIHLEGNAKSTYKLYCTAELGTDVEIPPPPSMIVYPPELPKDVRQNKEKPKPKEEVVLSKTSFFQFAPKNRSKSNSVTSLNSCASDSSQRNYLTSQNSPVPQVKSIKENLPKELQEGCKEVIYVTHIVDPHNFYVQRACHQRQVKDMLREFRNAVSLPKPSLNHVTEGKAYLAFNEADKMWQRCRVSRVDRSRPDRPLFHVFCYDFGSVEVVNIDGLRLLAPPRAVAPSPLAIHCALANCVPKNGTWMQDDSILVQNIIDNKQAVIHVREVRVTATAGRQLVCDVITFDDGVSLAHALVFHERAKMPNPRLKYPNSIGVRDRLKIHMGHDDYKPKSVDTVTITHVVSPDKFYVRKRHQQAVFEKLSLELEQEYSFGSPEHVYLPEVGMAVAVRVEEEGGWARGVVTELPGRGRALLHRVDTGAPLLAHWPLLRPLRPAHAALSALATECHLAGVTPLNKKWKPASAQLLRQYVGRELELRAEESRRGSVAVVLYDVTDDGDPVCLNEQMIKFKFAVSFGMYSFNRHTEERVLTDKCPLDKPAQTRPKHDPNRIQILKKTAPLPEKKTDLEAINKGPLRLEAKLLQYQSPSLIYVSLAHQQKIFYEMFEKMQAYYSKERPATGGEWKVGDMCCTVASQSMTWRRAVILELDDKEAKVFYSDFAYVETVTVKSLKVLPEEFAAIGEAAVKCHLYGVTPAVGEEWPSITKEFLKELIDAYNRIFITKVGDFKNKSMPVEIWVYHTIQGGALEPNRSEWRCLNHRIIEQGLAIPDRSLQVAKPEEPQPSKDGEETLSFLNVKGTVREWLQLEPMPMQPSHVSAEPRSQTSSPKDLDEQADASNVVFITDWLPPEPFENKEFMGMPTYVDNEGVIYLHDVEKKDTLDILRKALDVRFKEPDRKAKYVKWTVGEPCIAQYYLDSRYYRGRVVHVDAADAVCTVHYIDYGNEEQCSFVNMRKSIALHQIPTQARRCVLSGIRAAGARWDRRALDYLHGCVVEKTCRVTVVGEPLDGVTPIRLTHGTLCINDNLVEFEMAEYVDGSKATVRKFAPTDPIGKNSAGASDSEPDYFVEDDDVMSDSRSLQGKKWSELLEDNTEDDYEEITNAYYPKVTDTRFKCTITVINDYKTLELSIVQDEETALMYVEMSKDMQNDAENMPSLKADEMYENRPCMVFFDEDNQWYRALIMIYSEKEQKVRVKFVDYGNIEIVSLDNVRKICEDWAQLTPATVTVQLYGVALDPNVDIAILPQEYKDTFLDKNPFNVTVIKNDPIMCVELRNDEGELIYQNLIEKGVFVKCESE